MEDCPSNLKLSSRVLLLLISELRRALQRALQVLERNLDFVPGARETLDTSASK